MSVQKDGAKAPSKDAAPAPAAQAEPTPAEQLDAQQHASIAARAAQTAEQRAQLAMTAEKGASEHLAAAQQAAAAAGQDAVSAAGAAEASARSMAQAQKLRDDAGEAAKGADSALESANAAAQRAASAAEAADLAARKAQQTALQLAQVGAAEAADPPVLKLTAARKYTGDFAPQLADDGLTAVLRYAPRRDSVDSQDNPERSVGLDGYCDLRTGVKVGVPAGYVGDVTFAGRKNERVPAAVVEGDGDEELIVRVWNRTGGFMTIRAGDELARITLRRLAPIKLDYADPYAEPAPAK